jgi:hypothetical protein
MKLGTKCPDKLSSYIERSFQKCINQQEREFMEAALKKICNASKAKGSLFQRDWDALPVPTLPREGKLSWLTVQALTTQRTMRDWKLWT